MPKYRSWSGRIVEVKSNKDILSSQTEKIYFKERPSVAKEVSTD